MARNKLHNDSGTKLSVYKNTVKYVGPSGKDKDTVAKWAALDKAAYTEQQRRAVERKAAKDDQPLANLTLAQVATMVRRSPSQRSAIIATVINEILYGSL
jgi:precorrin-4 methylase